MTTSTYENLISEARDFTQDAVAPFRNDDSFYLKHLNRALMELGRMRPDAFYELFDANELNIPTVVDDDDAETPYVDWGTVFQVDSMFYAPILAYLVGISEVQDDEFTDEGRAAMMLAAFRNSVLGL